MFVGTVIVENKVDVQAGIGGRVDAIEEPQELLMPMPRLAVRDHSPFENVQSGKQSSGSVPFLVMGLPFRQIGPQWKNRLCAVQRLNLALLIHTKNNCLIRRVQIKPDDVAHLQSKFRIGA